MTNHVSMGDILTMTPDELMNLPVESLLSIQGEISAESERLKQIKMVFDGALDKRYAEQMECAYSKKGEPFGKTSFHDDFAVIEVNTPKRISWDEDGLRVAEDTIRNVWRDNPENYMTVSRKISESAWKNWPPAIRGLFEDARTEGAGKRSVVIKDAAKEGGA